MVAMAFGLEQDHSLMTIHSLCFKVYYDKKM